MSPHTQENPATNASRDNTKADNKCTKTQSNGAKGSPQHNQQQQRMEQDVDRDEYRKPEISPQSARQALASGPASVKAVSSIMGPPPPRDEKMSFWKQWKRGSQESRELRKLGMPALESDRRWKVSQIV